MLSAAAKKNLARLIQRCIDGGFGETLVEEAGGEEEADALAWEAVANDVRYVGDVYLRRFVLARPMSAERAAILATHLARHLPPEDGAQYLPRWYIDVDTLVYRALPLAPTERSSVRSVGDAAERARLRGGLHRSPNTPRVAPSLGDVDPARIHPQPVDPVDEGLALESRRTVRARARARVVRRRAGTAVAAAAAVDADAAVCGGRRRWRVVDPELGSSVGVGHEEDAVREHGQVAR